MRPRIRQNHCPARFSGLSGPPTHEKFISPAPGMDKSQRRMMAFMMPAVFGVSMWNFASGLALYWCTGNLLNLGIQLMMNQSSMGRELHAVAAKRATKGQSKTIQGRR